MHSYTYPRPMVTVDIVLRREGACGTELLLIQRTNAPFAGCWAFPGGFVDEDEDLQDAAHRELSEETGLVDVALCQWGAVGTPGRDPRGHTISVIYTGSCPRANSMVKAGDDAARAEWFPLGGLPDLAFDHETILKNLQSATTQEPGDEN